MHVHVRTPSILWRITLQCFLLLAVSMVATAAGDGHHEALPAFAEEVIGIGPKSPETGKSFISITNSMIMLWIVAAAIIFVAQAATRDVKLIPSGLQNFVEWLVETLYNFFGGILGEKMVKKTFWFFGTVFILILFSNWSGLIPGVGTIGWQRVGPEDLLVDGTGQTDAFRPFLRGVNADLNMTMSMALVFAVMWFVWSIKEIGFGAFVDHIFGAKGTFKGIMKVFMVLLFFFVGVIEMFSILVRPVALMFRLYGNIFAGENILETMMTLVPSWLAWLPPLPFYFLELLVGFVQALVFALLTAVFLKLMTDHDDHGHDHEEGHGESHDAEAAPSTT
jgi:F-type H+-transporting ATPase subunit a